MKERIIPITLFIYLIAYTVLTFLVGRETASLVKSLIIIFMVAVLLVHNKGNNSIELYDKFLFPLFFLFCIIQLFIFYNSEIVRFAINIIVFYVFFKRANEDFFKSLSVSIKIVTLIASLSVVWVSLRYGQMMYFRDEAIIDKSYLTAFYTLSYIFCFVDIVFKNNIKINAFLLLFFIIINVLIVQSKASILLIPTIPIITYLVATEKRKEIRKTIFYGLLVVLVLSALFPQIVLPEQLKYGANRIAGIELFEENYTMMESHLSYTYDVRIGMREYCYELFSNNPLVGIGIGNFKNYNRYSGNFFNHLTETESSWLQILTEGGLFLIAIYLILFLTPIISCIKHFKKHEVIDAYIPMTCMCFSLCFFLLFFYNDFTDSFFWISAGIILGIYFKGVKHEKCGLNYVSSNSY